MKEDIDRLFGITKIDPALYKTSLFEHELKTEHELKKFHLSRGYPECVAKKIPGKKHSLHNLDRYIFDRVPQEVIQDIINHNRKVEFHCFPEELSFAFLKNRGYRIYYQIHTVSGLSHKGLYIAAKSNGLNPVYIVNRIFGQEKLFHNLMMFRLAVIKGKTVSKDNILVYNHDDYNFENTVKLYSGALENEGRLPETVIINYQNSILNDLVKRKKSRIIYELWEKKFGPKPVLGIINYLENKKEDINISSKHFSAYCLLIEHIKRIISKNRFLKRVNTLEKIFQNRKYSDTINRIYDFFLSCSEYLDLKECLFDKEPKKVTAFLDSQYRYGKTVSDGILNRSSFKYITGQGIIKTALVFRCVWGGDNIRALGTVLYNKMKKGGVKNFIHLGTAGSFDPEFGAGTVHVPKAIFDTDNKRVDINYKNFLNDFIIRKGVVPGVKTDSRLVRVWSPLVEDEDFINLMVKNNYTTVEVEIAAIHRLFESLKPNLKIGEMVMITDLLGSDITLEQHGASNISLEQKAFRKGFEYIVHYLDIADIVE